MIKFLLLDRQEFKRILSGRYSIYESLLWVLCTTLFFVGFGAGSILIDLLAPFCVSILLAFVVTCCLARETWRYEWVDRAGVSVSNHPTLLSRCLILIFRASVLYIPVAFFSYWGAVEFLWIFKLIYVFIASIWLIFILTFGAKVLWRIPFKQALIINVMSYLVLCFPMGVLCLRGYWTRKIVDLVDITVMSRFERYSSYVMLAIGFIAIVYTIFRVTNFMLKGGVGFEKHRRCKLLKTPLHGNQVIVLVLLVLPFSVSGVFNRIDQIKITEFFAKQEIDRVIEVLETHDSHLHPGVPYGSDFMNLQALIRFHRKIKRESPHSKHLLRTARFWWAKRGTKKVRDLRLEYLNVKRLNEFQKLMIIQVKLDKDGEFVHFVLSQGYLKYDVVKAILSGKLDDQLNL